MSRDQQTSDNWRNGPSITFPNDIGITNILKPYTSISAMNTKNVGPGG